MLLHSQPLRTNIPGHRLHNTIAMDSYIQAHGLGPALVPVADSYSLAPTPTVPTVYRKFPQVFSSCFLDLMDASNRYRHPRLCVTLIPG
jgi:hypothetical protein